MSLSRSLAIGLIAGLSLTAAGRDHDSDKRGYDKKQEQHHEEQHAQPQQAPPRQPDPPREAPRVDPPRQAPVVHDAPRQPDTRGNNSRGGDSRGGGGNNQPTRHAPIVHQENHQPDASNQPQIQPDLVRQEPIRIQPSPDRGDPSVRQNPGQGNQHGNNDGGQSNPYNIRIRDQRNNDGNPGEQIQPAPLKGSDRHASPVYEYRARAIDRRPQAPTRHAPIQQNDPSRGGMDVRHGDTRGGWGGNGAGGGAGASQVGSLGDTHGNNSGGDGHHGNAGGDNGGHGSGFGGGGGIAAGPTRTEQGDTRGSVRVGGNYGGSGGDHGNYGGDRGGDNNRHGGGDRYGNHSGDRHGDSHHDSNRANWGDHHREYRSVHDTRKAEFRKNFSPWRHDDHSPRPRHFFSVNVNYYNYYSSIDQYIYPSIDVVEYPPYAWFDSSVCVEQPRTEYYCERYWYRPRTVYYRQPRNSFYFFVNLGDYAERCVPTYVRDAYVQANWTHDDIFEATDWQGIAYASFAQGNYQTSINAFGNALARDRYNGPLYFGRAQAEFAAGLISEASADLLTGLRLVPDWPDVKMSLFELYDNPQDLDAQLSRLESWVQANPDSFEGHFVLAYMYYFTQWYDAANDELLYALDIDPGNGPVIRMLDAIAARRKPS